MTPSLKQQSEPIENAGLRADLNNTFANFKPVPGTEVTIAAIRGVIDGKRPIVWISGGVGNGKTHLLHAAAIELYQRGQYTRVYQFADILSGLKATINNPEMNYDHLLGGFCYAKRLIIDDIGAGGSANEHGYKVLESIFCARYERELLTIMSTNLDIENVDFPERVRSRIKDRSRCYLVVNEAPDYRPHKGVSDKEG